VIVDNKLLSVAFLSIRAGLCTMTVLSSISFTSPYLRNYLKVLFVGDRFRAHFF